MPDGDSKIDEKKVFIDLFDIYEQELLTIFQYIAPINNKCNIIDSKGKKCECGCKINLNVSGNKIHELHLRVCAESENLMKRIAKKLFPERDFDKEYQDEKFKDIKEILDNMPEKYRKEIKKNYRHADMPFYLNILNNELGICNKKIEFCKFIETKLENQILFIQPLKKSNETGVIPLWRENYNKIKHDKIDNYTLCTLENLIHSLGAYYLLLNYFIFDSKKCVYKSEEINSVLFKPTIGWIVYPQIIWEYFSQFRENKPSPFLDEIYIGNKEIIPKYYDETLKNEIQNILKESNSRLILSDMIGKNTTGLSEINYLYYNFFEQQEVIYGGSLGNNDSSLWTLKLKTKINTKK